MQTDRDLLEAAARAYGVKLDYRHGSDAYYYDDPEMGREEWKPHRDDGQALRLAVKLKLNIAQGDFSVGVNDEDEVDEAALVKSDEDRAQVLRICIVRAAAALAPQPNKGEAK